MPAPPSTSERRQSPMFTGIVEGTRRVTRVERGSFGMRLGIDLDDLARGVGLGDSIAVNGCCLTVDALDGSVARFHAGDETLALTALGDVVDGDVVNVERSLAVGDALGGHLVTGHVDGVGEVTEVVPTEAQTDMTFTLPEVLAAQAIHKGSIAIDGVSLTITGIDGPRVSVMLIPHTLEVTTLGRRGVGARVNIETDMIGKWVGHHLASILERLDRLEAGSDE